MKPLRGLSGDVCQQQTDFLVRELQARLQIKLSEQGSADVLKAHLVTRQQNMALVFHRFNMRGPGGKVRQVADGKAERSTTVIENKCFAVVAM